MEICILSINYPTEKQQIHVFLDNLVKQFVDRGITCNVIAPQSIYSYFKRKDFRRDFVSERETNLGNKYTVFSPLFMIYPTIKIGNLCISDLSKKSLFRSALHAYRKHSLCADLIYSHFFQAGISAVMLGEKLNLPVYIANGEADTIEETSYISKGLIKETLEKVTGIISVSTKCKEEIRTLCNNSKDVMNKVTVIPNAANSKKFHKMDKIDCRRKLGYAEDAFIIAFTGSFIPRKGIQKVVRAVEAIPNVWVEFIGTGSEKPNCKNILFCGKVKNEEMAIYLNAADVFVLPTLAEGCCNAIVEAVCCGLPVISSDRSFNWDILDDTCSIMIDPESDEEIQNAIKKLKDDAPLRERLASGSIEKCKMLSLDNRTDRILELLSKRGV